MRLSKEELILKVGERVREIRLSKGLTLERVAFDAGIDYTQLSRIELGKINTSIYQIYIVSKSLDVPLPELLNIKNLSNTNNS
jgi:transcriptional regulator with XRE-family HTH domain